MACDHFKFRKFTGGRDPHNGFSNQRHQSKATRTQQPTATRTQPLKKITEKIRNLKIEGKDKEEIAEYFGIMHNYLQWKLMINKFGSLPSVLLAI